MLQALTYKIKKDYFFGLKIMPVNRIQKQNFEKMNAQKCFGKHHASH